MMIHASNFSKHFSMKKKLHCEHIKSKTRLRNVNDKFANVFSFLLLILRQDSQELFHASFVNSLLKSQSTLLSYCSLMEDTLIHIYWPRSPRERRVLRTPSLLSLVKGGCSKFNFSFDISKNMKITFQSIFEELKSFHGS